MSKSDMYANLEQAEGNDLIDESNRLKELNRLFVYGIFLDESARNSTGMSEPYYATVRGYATIGGQIVTAYPTEGYTLTGMVVEVDPDFWQIIDSIESYYKRVRIITTDGVECWMYVGI